MLVVSGLGSSGGSPVPFACRRGNLVPSDDVRGRLEAVVRSRLESVQRVARAPIVLAFADGRSVSAIDRTLIRPPKSSHPIGSRALDTLQTRQSKPSTNP